MPAELVAASDDSPMLTSGRLPPFPGGPSAPAGFLQRISTLTSSSFPFFLDFLGAICRIRPWSGVAQRYERLYPLTPQGIVNAQIIAAPKGATFSRRSPRKSVESLLLLSTKSYVRNRGIFFRPEANFGPATRTHHE
jgi:hypothetical protein